MSYSRAIFLIILSTLLVSGSAFMGWLYYLHIREKRVHDNRYDIIAIVQSSSQTDRLKSIYLAELLHLSIDHPTNLYQFNAKEAAKTLESNPLIQSAKVRKSLPGTLYIDYKLRIPIAFVGEYSNTAVDKQGHLFPFRPFFTPKQIPTFYLGLNEGEGKWGSSVKDQMRFKFACNLCRELGVLDAGYIVKQIDVSQVASNSCGRRQIVMVVENRDKSLFFLRLNSDDPVKSLGNFHILMKNQKLPSGSVIDLRVPSLALLSS